MDLVDFTILHVTYVFHNVCFNAYLRLGYVKYEISRVRESPPQQRLKIGEKHARKDVKKRNVVSSNRSENFYMHKQINVLFNHFTVCDFWAILLLFKI